MTKTVLSNRFTVITVPEGYLHYYVYCIHTMEMGLNGSVSLPTSTLGDVTLVG